MAKLLYFDLETTGLFAWKNGVVQIGAVVEIDGVEKEELNLELQPFRDDVIESKALEVNGIDESTLWDRLDPVLGFKQLEAMLEKYVRKYDKTDKFTLVGYNSQSFDDAFFRKFFSKCGSKYYGSWFYSAHIDVMCLAAHALLNKRHEMENFKLGTVAAALGIQPDGQLHDALTDVRLTRDIYKAIVG